jgi:DNA-binding transcriptional MerR regulator
VLLFRELGFSLEAIQHLLSDANYDRKAALEAQRELLHERLERTETILRAVDAALQELNGETRMSTEEMFEGFEDFNKQYEDEARERWGGSAAYEESMRRTKGYSQADWKRFKEESAQGMQRFAELLASDASPTGSEAMDLAEGARQAITKWFYDCSPSMHRNLADMYEADPRFTATFEKHGAGMTAFVAAAIRANADRQEAP